MAWQPDPSLTDAEQALQWVEMLSDRPRALKWAEEEAREWVLRYPERDLKKELAKWRKIALAGVEGSGIETQGL